MVRHRMLRGLVALALLALAAGPWLAPAVHGQVPAGTISVAGVGGSFPVNLDVNESTGRLYVVARDSNNLLVFDATTTGFVASIPLGTRPFDVAVNALTNRIYATNDGQPPSVAVIDGATNTVLTTITLPSLPPPAAGVTPTPFVAVNPLTNTIYVTDNSRNVIHVISGATNTLVTSIPVTLPPNFQLRGIAVNPATNRFYVVRSDQTPGAGAGSVQVFDGATNLPLTVVTVGVGPEDITVDPTRNRIYVTNLGTTAAPGSTLSVIDGATNAVVSTVTVGTSPRGLDVNTSDGRVFVANTTSGTVSVVDGPSGLVLGTVSVPGAAWVAANSTNNRVYISSGAQNTVTILADVRSCPTNQATVTLTQTGGSGVFGTLTLTFNPATNSTTISGTITGVTAAPTVSLFTTAGPPQPRTVTGSAPVGGTSTVSGSVPGNFFAGSQVTVGTVAAGQVVCSTPVPTPPTVQPLGPGGQILPQVAIPAVPRPPVQIIPAPPPPLLPPGPPLPPLQSAAQQPPPGAPPRPAAPGGMMEMPAPMATPTPAATATPTAAPTTAPATPMATPTGAGTQPAPGQLGPSDGPPAVPQQPTPMATPRAETPSDTGAVPAEPGMGEPASSTSEPLPTPESEPSDLPLPVEGLGLLLLGLVGAARTRRAR